MPAISYGIGAFRQSIGLETDEDVTKLAQDFADSAEGIWIRCAQFDDVNENGGAALAWLPKDTVVEFVYESVIPADAPGVQG